MIILSIVIAIIIIGLLMWERSPFSIYCKSEARRAIVRTGLGGAKAVLGTGSFVIPLVHKIQWVDLEETRLLISRQGKESIITKDLFRTDIEIEFYIRVIATREAVIKAATSLGRKADSSDNLKDYVEPELTSAVHSAVSEMALIEIHKNRLLLTKTIKECVKDDLELKGLEVTSVTISMLNQTPSEYYDENNIFDSQGLLSITETTEGRKKERIKIEQEQALLTERNNVEIKKQLFDLEREKAIAEKTAHNEIESQKEEKEKELTLFRLVQQRESELAKVTYEQEIEEKRLLKEKYIEGQKIENEKFINFAKSQRDLEIEQKRINTEGEIQSTSIRREMDISTEKKKKAEVTIDNEKEVEILRILTNNEIEKQKVEGDLKIKKAEINKNLQLEQDNINYDGKIKVCGIQKEIELINEQKNREVKEEERNKEVELTKLETQKAISEEEKRLTLVQLETIKSKTEREIADQELLSVRVKSQAERQKAAGVIKAEEDAEKRRIDTKSKVDDQIYEIQKMTDKKYENLEKEATTLERLSEARKKEIISKADGERALIEARNLVADHILKNERATKLIGELAKIASELMKPVEKIDSIKVVNIDGLTPMSGEGGMEYDKDQSLLSYGGARSAMTGIINGILQVGAFKPVIRELFDSDGVKDVEQEHIVKILNDLVPGLIKEGGKELVRTSIRKEELRKQDLENKSSARQDKKDN
jgi:uncharacterized membrane protein YqiK